MRKLSILVCFVILNVFATGFKLMPWRTTGRQGWSLLMRRLQHFGIDPEDAKLGQGVISSQPDVLVCAKNDCRAFSNWKGNKLNLNASGNQPGLLPFVGRLETVISITLTMISNFRRAVHIEEGCAAEKRYLSLVGCGALTGTGKSVIGPVVGQCLQRMLGIDKKVIGVVSKVKARGSTYRMWVEDVCTTPGMEELRPLIHKDMSFKEVMEETDQLLSERKMVLFLHLDDFSPFNKTGCTANTAEEFYLCWHRLMPILCSPNIGLYISGHMPYYDSVGYSCGQPPCSSLSVPFDLLSTETIHAALDKIFIPRDTHTDDYTVTLSQALDQLFATGPGHAPPQQQQHGSWEIAQKLHNVTGGVPRYVECALYALLSNPAIHSSLFKRDGSVPSADQLNRLFNRGGDVYQAVTIASSVHLDTIGAGNVDKEERTKRLTGLMQLLFLKERTVQLTEWESKRLTSSHCATSSSIAQLSSHAQFWGIHRNFNESEGLISFAVPSAVLDGLAPALVDLQSLLPSLKDNNVQQPDPLGMQSEHEVLIILALHRLLATLLRHDNWLGLIDDTNNPLTLLNHPVVCATPSYSRVWDLPRLPSVHPYGRLRDERALRRSITYDDHNVSNLRQADVPPDEDNLLDREHKCRPALLGRFLNSLPSNAFHAFRMAPRGSGGHFLVQYRANVTHIHVAHSEPLTFLSVLLTCGEIVPVLKASSELLHTLAFVITQPQARAEAVQTIGSLSSEHLIEQLKDTLKHWEVPESKQGRRQGKNMHLAVNLIRKGKLKVVILDEAQYSRFTHYRELAKQLVVDDSL